MVTADAMFYSCKSHFREKNPFLPIEKFPFLAQARNMIMSQHLTIHFLLHQPSSRRLREVKNKGKFQTFSSISARGHLREVVAYLLTTGSKYNDLIWKLLVFWKTGRREGVVAYERWSQPDQGARDQESTNHRAHFLE